MTEHGGMLSRVCLWVESFSLSRSLSVSLAPPPLPLCLSLSLCMCVCVCHVSCAVVLGSRREGVQYEWGRAVLACGPKAGCYSLVAVLRWWPWSEPPSRKWWSSYTGSRGWPSPRHATRNSARYVPRRVDWKREFLLFVVCCCCVYFSQLEGKCVLFFYWTIDLTAITIFNACSSALFVLLFLMYSSPVVVQV